MARLTADEWLNEIQNGLEYREIFAKERTWKDIEDCYFHEPGSIASMGTNLIYSMGDSLSSALTVPNPEFVIQADHPEMVDRAPILESVDNWLVKKLKFKKNIEAATINSYLYSRAIVKIGYDSEFGWSPNHDSGIRQPIGMSFTQFDKKGYRIEKPSTLPGMPWLSVVHPHDFVVPWGTVDLDDAPWCAHRFVRLTSNLKADPKYINTNRLEPQMSMRDYMKSYDSVLAKGKMARNKNSHSYFAQNEPLFTEAWEIHDRCTGKVFVVCSDYDKFLRDEGDALQVCGMPFVSSSFINHPRSFWSTPQSFYLYQIQSTEYDIAVQSEKQRRINVVRFLMDKNAITFDEANKLVSGEVGAVAQANTSRPLRDVFAPLPAGNNYDLSMEAQNNRGNARDTIGYSRNQVGEFDDSSRRTAAETRQVAAGAGRRESKRFSVVEDLYVESIQKLNKLIFSFWKTPRYTLSADRWITFTGDELKGDYLYDISLSTKRNLSVAERKIEALTMLPQFLQMGIPPQQAFKFLIDAANDPAFERLVIGQAQKQLNAPMSAPVNGIQPQPMGGSI